MNLDYKKKKEEVQVEADGEQSAQDDAKAAGDTFNASQKAKTITEEPTGEIKTVKCPECGN